MSRIAAEIIVGLASLLTGLAAGMRAVRQQERLRKRVPNLAAGARVPSPTASLPIAVGLATGVVLACGLMFTVASDDRFYSPAAAIRVAIATLAGYLLIAFSDVLVVWGTFLFCGGHRTHARNEPLADALERAMSKRWAVSLVAELLATVLVVVCGVKFRVIGMGPEHAWELGLWAAPLTMMWILAATNIGKLLSGIDGAANILLLAAAGMVFCVTLGVNEHFLNTLGVIIACATVASLRFNFHPARLALTSAGTTAIGFLFAVLTVLARQKTAVMFLLILPMVVVVLIVGGAMMNFVERSISTDDNRRE
jgi:hypothetical protein